MDKPFNWTMAVAWGLGLLPLLWGIYTYSTTAAQTNRVPFLTKQTELLFEASTVTAELSVLTEKATWETARQRFWVLYYGPLAAVENVAVACQMIAAGDILTNAGDGNAHFPIPDLHEPSLKLAQAARDLVLAGWQVSIPPLQPDKPVTPPTSTTGCPSNSKG
jgi:hypothetical protein